MNLTESVEHFALSHCDLQDGQLDIPWQWGDYDEGVRFAFFRVYETLRLLAAEITPQRAAYRPWTTAQALLGHYHSAYRDWQAVHLGLSDELALRRPAPGEWSVRTSLAHMLDAEITFWFLNSQALLQIRNGQTPERPTEAEWSELTRREQFFEIAEEGAFSALAACQADLHWRVIDTLAGASDAELAARVWFWESQPMTMQFRLERFDSHMRQHTIQAEKALASLGHLPNEARRLLRLIYQALACVEAAQIGAPEFALPACAQAAEEIFSYNSQVIAALTAAGEKKTA